MFCFWCAQIQYNTPNVSKVQLFTALFIIARFWIKPKCLKTDEWIKKITAVICRFAAVSFNCHAADSCRIDCRGPKLLGCRFMVAEIQGCQGPMRGPMRPCCWEGPGVQYQFVVTAMKGDRREERRKTYISFLFPNII